jgi:electron transfer flavoprotein alpha subunit
LLASVAERLKPTLVLFPEGESGPALGPALAERMGATFMPCSTLEILAATDLQLAQVVVRCGQADRGQERVVGLHEIGRPVVVTLCAGETSRALGEPAAEMEMLSYPI